MADVSLRAKQWTILPLLKYEMCVLVKDSTVTLKQASVIPESRSRTSYMGEGSEFN